MNIKLKIRFEVLPMSHVDPCEVIFLEVRICGISYYSKAETVFDKNSEEDAIS